MEKLKGVYKKKVGGWEKRGKGCQIEGKKR